MKNQFLWVLLTKTKLATQIHFIIRILDKQDRQAGQAEQGGKKSIHCIIKIEARW